MGASPQPEMSVAIFRTMCGQHGLTCVKQELVNWRGKRLIDCFSWFERSAVKSGDHDRDCAKSEFYAGGGRDSARTNL